MQPLYYLLYSGQFIPAARPQGVLACSLKSRIITQKKYLPVQNKIVQAVLKGVDINYCRYGHVLKPIGNQISITQPQT
jgi:hypothetical protein